MSTNNNHIKNFELTMTTKLNIITEVFSDVKQFCENSFKNPEKYIEIFFRRELKTEFLIWSSKISNDIHIDIDVPKPQQSKKFRTVEVPKKFEAVKYKQSQKMSYVFGEITPDSLKNIDDDIKFLGLYNPKNLNEVTRMNFAKFLSKKYAKNEYSYLEYFFKNLQKSSMRHNAKKFMQSITYTEFSIKTIDGETVKIMNDCVAKYDKLHKQMHTDKIAFETQKHKMNMLKSVQDFKKFKNLVTEYEKSISDLTFKLANYEFINMEYQKDLLESYEFLLIDAKVNKKLSEVEMLADKKYLRMFDKVETLKSTYKKSLQAVIDYRKNFNEYKIFKRVAAYIYVDIKTNQKVINGIKWNLKSPSGKLHSKTTLSSLQKAYNVVKFDKVEKKLIINSGL